MALSSLGALLKALGDLFADFHGRVMDFLAEADPRTTDELLAEWERVYGLPLCDDAPTGDDERRAALAGRVAAVGGQTPAYYIDIIRAVLGDPAAVVTITERPYGSPFYAWLSEAWDAATDEGAAHYWRVLLPSGTSPDRAHIIQCLLEAYKPAHTVLELVGGVTAYYASPGGDGEWAKASSPVAARLFFSDTASPVVSYVCWARRPDTVETLALVDVIHETDDTLARLRWTDDPLVTFEVFNSVGSGASNDLTPPGADSEWHQFALVCNGTTAKVYLDGVEVDSQSLGATPYGVCDELMLFALHITGLAAQGDIRNIGIFDRALSAAEIDALFAAPGAETHDCRVATGAWAGEVPSVYWCQAGRAGSRIRYYYTIAEAGVLEASGYTMPDEEDAALMFWFRVTNDQNGDLHAEPGEDSVIGVTGNNGTTFRLEFSELEIDRDLACNEWHLVVLNSATGEIECYIDGETDGAVGYGQINGNPVFGDGSGGTIHIDVANIHYFARRLTSDEIVALYDASVDGDPLVASGDWPGLESEIEWVLEAVGDDVANTGVGTAHLLNFTAGGAGGFLDTPAFIVASSGSAGVCDLHLYANVTSEED